MNECMCEKVSAMYKQVYFSSIRTFTLQLILKYCICFHGIGNSIRVRVHITRARASPHYTLYYIYLIVKQCFAQSVRKE